MTIANRVFCPQCKRDITEHEFTNDSEVRGFLDIGYECQHCQIDVMTLVIEKKTSKTSKTCKGENEMEQHIQYAIEILKGEISKLENMAELSDGFEEKEEIRLDIQRIEQSILEIEQKFTL